MDDKNSEKEEKNLLKEDVTLIDNNRSLRDYIWSYPDFVEFIYKKLRPFSFIFIFILLGILLYSTYDKWSIDFLKSTETSVNFIEGTLGRNSIINPIYISQNQVDRDIRKLVFQKFIIIDKDGKPNPEIADTWSYDTENKIYTFNIKKNLFFSDGTQLTSKDILYTFDLSKKLNINNRDTIAKNIEGVEISTEGDFKIKFKLPEDNSTFFEAISVYILSSRQLSQYTEDEIEQFESDYLFIGSGPFSINEIKPGGVKMVRNEFFSNKPDIENFEIRFFQDINDLKVAYRNNLLDAVSNYGSLAEEPDWEITGYEEIKMDMPTRKRVILFNTRLDLLNNSSIRRGIISLTDKEKLIEEEDIEGIPIWGPYNEDNPMYNKDAGFLKYDLEKAKKELGDAGYTIDDTTGFFVNSEEKILSFTLTYYNTPVNNKIAENLEKQYLENGFILKLNPQDYEKFIQETIATRNFEMILVELETTIDPDQYNLWHSLKVDYPDLNISGFRFSKIDILLERTRKSLDEEERKKDYALFQKYLINEAPVLFLYEPKYKYLVSNKFDYEDFNDVIYPEDRYNNVENWSKAEI